VGARCQERVQCFSALFHFKYKLLLQLSEVVRTGLAELGAWPPAENRASTAARVASAEASMLRYLRTGDDGEADAAEEAADDAVAKEKELVRKREERQRKKGRGPGMPHYSSGANVALGDVQHDGYVRVGDRRGGRGGRLHSGSGSGSGSMAG
jgi:hypothetical protein